MRFVAGSFGVRKAPAVRGSFGGKPGERVASGQTLGHQPANHSEVETNDERQQCKSGELIRVEAGDHRRTVWEVSTLKYAALSQRFRCRLANDKTSNDRTSKQQSLQKD